jgi:beta-xylosidase/enterochelin esterase-like enzyme
MKRVKMVNVRGWRYLFCVALVLALLPLMAQEPARNPRRAFDRRIVLGPDDRQLFPDPPAGFDRKRDIPHGRVEMAEYDSQTVGAVRRMQVYTPPGYDVKKSYPTLYLLHGIGGDETEWENACRVSTVMDNLIAERKALPMIVVMPNGRARKDDRARGNLFSAENVAAFEAFEQDLLQNLIPAVESRYGAAKEREWRALAGLSMGGGQSLNIGLTHLKTFAWVGGFSSAPNTRPPKELMPDPKAAAARLKLLWLSCGKRDGLINFSQRMHAYLKEHGVPHLWTVSSHGHDATEWRAALYYFAQQLFKPSPLTPPQTDNAGGTLRNPVIWADVPDMAMIRVGDTYYMSSTTMHMNPGLPIMKSKDLVNWSLVSYVYEILDDTDDLALRNGKSAYGKGSWASSLRYHKGTFYASTFSGTTGKTYVYTAKDIEKGPWKVASFKPMLHDHSLFFDDDGRVYMVYGGGQIRIRELTADASAVKPGGIDQTIIENASLAAGPKVGLPAEGSQLIKVENTYYLFNITWPQRDMRTVLVHRAKKITGPYEGRVAFHDQGIAQGSLIDTPDGRWFAYLFQDCGAVGRVPFLLPVEWKEGWPLIGDNGKVPDTVPLPASKGLIPGIVASDEFTRRPGDPALPLVWQWNHNPDNSAWSLTERPGFLRLKNRKIAAGLLDAPNSLTQRTFGPACSGSIAMDISKMKEGDCAGLAAFQKNYGFVGVKVSGGVKSVIMVDAGSGAPKEVAAMPLSQSTVDLKIVMDFKARADKATFFYSLDRQTWQPIGTTLKMTYTLPHFMGYRFALFSYATSTVGGSVDVDYFRITE